MKQIKFREEVWTGCINVRFISTYMMLKAMSLVDKLTNEVCIPRVTMLWN